VAKTLIRNTAVLINDGQTGAVFTKLIFFVEYEWARKASVFVFDRPSCQTFYRAEMACQAQTL
jgi:hypothetical protein